jgi:hypothetical protein
VIASSDAQRSRDDPPSPRGLARKLHVGPYAADAERRLRHRRLCAPTGARPSVHGALRLLRRKRVRRR